MAEKEYIERKAAKDAIFEYICGHTMSKFPSKELLKASKMGAEGALNEIDYVPAADVVEVRHGYWYFTEYEYFDCSECGESYLNGCDCTYEAKEKLRTGDLYKYCPKCGAKMDGGKHG